MPDCFSIETLRSWLANELSSSERATVGDHVARCAVCQSRLDAETDDATLRRWLECGPDGQIDNVDLEISERLISAICLPPTETAPGCETESSQTVGFAEPEADIGHIGTFRLMDELGRGGMGIVYRAWDEPLGRVVAVKVLRPEHVGAVDRLRLVREAQLASRFQNDHAVTIHSVVDPPDALPYLVMEYVQGPTLADLIGSGRSPPPRDLAVLAGQVALALGAAHSAGLVHRDVKPSNILIDATTGRAKITDFGVARTLAAPSTITREGFVAGTPAYMSPEQARGDPDLDPRTDVYSLGATLYEGLTGQPPFAGALHAILRRITEEDPIPPRRFDHQIPGDIETICLKAMAKEPKDRYQTALDLGADLNRWLRDEPIQARPPNWLKRARRSCRRRPLVAGLALALLLVVTAGVSGISWKWAEAVSERRRAELERDRAQRNFRQAREAVDTYLTQVSDNDVLKAQNLEPLRRELLRTARDFYERFVAQDPADPDLQADLGKGHGRLGLITSVLESRPKALEHYQRMRTVFDRLHERYPDNLVYASNLVDSLRELGESHQSLAQPDLAHTTLQKALSSSEELSRSHPANGHYRHLVGDIAYSLASLNFHERNQPAVARVLLRKALDIEQDLSISFPAVAEYVFYLNNILRDFRDWFGDTARLDDVRDHFTVLIQEYEAQFPPEKRDPIRLKRYYLHRAEIHRLMARYSEAHADFKQAGWSLLEQNTAAVLHAQRSDYDQAEAAAISVVRQGPANGQTLYVAAKVAAFMAAAVRNDRALAPGRREELGEKYSREAVHWLQEAQSLKYLSAPTTRYLLADDRDLSPLRSRDDFRALLGRSIRARKTGK